MRKIGERAGGCGLAGLGRMKWKRKFESEKIL